MIRTWKFGLPALLVAGLLVSPARAQNPEKLDMILNELREMRKQNEAQQKLNDLKSAAMELEITALRKRITDMELLIEKLAKERVSNYPFPNTPRDRTSYYIPGDTVSPPVSIVGVVRIQNLSFRPTQVAVNGLTFTVAPLDTVSTTVPAGTFTYQVLMDGRGYGHTVQTRALPGNESFTIFLNP
jgi:hypothetical protein